MITATNQKPFTDDVTDSILRLAAAIRSGEIIGLAVVTTNREGKVSMDTLLAPVIGNCTIRC